MKHHEIIFPMFNVNLMPKWLRAISVPSPSTCQARKAEKLQEEATSFTVLAYPKSSTFGHTFSLLLQKFGIYDVRSSSVPPAVGTPLLR